jgi:uncharacterized protein YhdP
VPVAAYSAPSAAGAPAARRTVLNFKLDIGDAGGLLARLGMPGTMRAGQGKIDGQLAWIGQPYAFDYPTLSGTLNIDVGKGQFLKVEPGAAKLLSILSLQTLPRRMLLDFSDVFNQGFAFDQITGDAKIDRGEAFTNNLKMRGSQATVLMEGTADIARESSKLFVVVEPDVNLGTASLAYAAINPAIGLTTFLLQWIARKPINKALTQQFEVSGSWYEPKVEKVDRSARVAADATSPSAAQ